MPDTSAKLRTLCTECATSATNKYVGDCQFEARALSKTESAGARYGLMENAQTLGERLFTIMEGGLDGREWTFSEFVPGQVRSRGNGGLSKMDCDFDPQTFETKRHKKKLNTELLYIHRKECMSKYIGSIYQGEQASDGLAFHSSSRLSEVKNSQRLFIDLMMYDYAAMSKALDGNNVLGNFGGSKGTNAGITAFPSYDGVIKQALQNGTATYYNEVTITLPEIGEGCLYLECNGDISPADDAADLVAQINELCVDITGKFPYSAVVGEGGVITIIANYPEGKAYGAGALQIFYSPTCELAGCDTPLEAVTVQCAMSWSQQPLLFDYNEGINCDNFFDYFVGKLKEINKKCIELTEDSSSFDSGYIAIDPLLLADKDFAEIQRLCNCANADAQNSAYNALFPRFVGLNVLKGTGLWYWSTTANLVFLTNTNADILNNTEIWYDRDCGHIKMRNEMLGNALVVDFNKFATNALGSPFAAKLNAPYEPENLPHYNGDLRSDACESPCAAGSNGGAACVTLCCPTEEGGDCKVILEDKSVYAEGDSLGEIVWAVYGSGEYTLSEQAANVEVAVPAGDCAGIQFVTSTVTTTLGETLVTTVPYTAFQSDCDFKTLAVATESTESGGGK